MELQQINELAGTLGEAIASHERCKTLREAVAALHADAEAKQLEQDYAAAAATLREKTGSGQPLEPEDKRREAELRNQVATHPTIRTFLRAQADFQELMNGVNQTLSDAIGLESPSAAPGE